MNGRGTRGRAGGRAEHGRLVRVVLGAVEASGCRVVAAVRVGATALRISFDTAVGERMEVLVYAVPAIVGRRARRVSQAARKRPAVAEELEHDPDGVITTLLVAVDVERGLFVGADPVANEGTAAIAGLRVPQRELEQVVTTGWHAWEREREDDEEPVEVLVGFTARNFLRYVRFERDAFAEEAGHRHMLAELRTPPSGAEPAATRSPPRPSAFPLASRTGPE